MGPNADGLTIVSWKTIRGRVEELCDRLSRSLCAQPWAVSVMIHEGYLLRRLVRRIEVVLVHAILEHKDIDVGHAHLVEDKVEPRNKIIHPALEFDEFRGVVRDILEQLFQQRDLGPPTLTLPESTKPGEKQSSVRIRRKDKIKTYDDR